MGGRLDGGEQALGGEGERVMIVSGTTSAQPIGTSISIRLTGLVSQVHPGITLASQGITLVSHGRMLGKCDN